MDLNGDGHLDLLSGSYSANEVDGMAGLFQVLWGSEDGFKKAAPLKGNDDKPLVIGNPGKDEKTMTRRICTRPTAVDWDADGDLDLLVGNFEGSLILFRGEGKGKFAPKSEELMVEGKNLAINGYHSDPFCVDLDGDGDLDILSGTANGGVQWAENTAGQGKEISVKGFKPLIKEGNRGPFWNDQKMAPAASTRVWADDVNGDGKLDILMGDSITIKTAAEGLSKAEAEKSQKDWSSKLSVMRNQMQQPTQDSKAMAKIREDYSKHYQSRSEFLTEDRTGFVWLYLGK